MQNDDTNKDLEINKITIQNKSILKQGTIDQLKNVEQEEKIISTPKVKNKSENNKINSFNELITICEEKKELKIKYELENNLKLVSFKDQKIEISFNSNLDKTIVKDYIIFLFFLPIFLLSLTIALIRDPFFFIFRRYRKRSKKNRSNVNYRYSNTKNNGSRKLVI